MSQTFLSLATTEAFANQRIPNAEDWETLLAPIHGAMVGMLRRSPRPQWVMIRRARVRNKRAARTVHQCVSSPNRSALGTALMRTPIKASGDTLWRATVATQRYEQRTTTGRSVVTVRRVLLDLLFPIVFSLPPRSLIRCPARPARA